VHASRRRSAPDFGELCRVAAHLPCRS
jgi:hypothetical protein